MLVQLRDHKFFEYISPKVSIYCLTFNHAPFIAQAFEGFLSQKTNFPVEIVVADDCSSDGSLSIIKEYNNRYPGLFRCLLQPTNKYSVGELISWSQGYPQCRGKYIALCEGDDFWVDPLKLQLQYDYLQANINTVLVYQNVIAVDSSDVPVSGYIGGALKDLSSSQLRKGYPLNTPTVMYRNIDISSRDLLYAPLGDITMWSRLGSFGSGKYLHSDKPCRYRVHQNGIFSSLSSARKSLHLVTTHCMLSSYYEHKDIDLSAYFASSACSQLLMITKFSHMPIILKLILKNLFSKILLLRLFRRGSL